MYRRLVYIIIQSQVISTSLRIAKSFIPRHIPEWFRISARTQEIFQIDILIYDCALFRTFHAGSLTQKEFIKMEYLSKRKMKVTQNIRLKLDLLLQILHQFIRREKVKSTLKQNSLILNQ